MGTGSGSGSDNSSGSDLVCKSSMCTIWCAKIQFAKFSVQYLLCMT